MYFMKARVTGERGAKAAATMDMVLRPGEALVWRWGHLTPVKYHGAAQSPPVYESTVCNGLWEYRPNFQEPTTWRKGATLVENISAEADGLAATGGGKGTMVWTMRAPYVFVGGRLEIEGTGAKFFVSTDGKSWQEAGNDLDKFFPPASPARYEYRVKCELEGAARLRRLGIVNDLQIGPLRLAGISGGSEHHVLLRSICGAAENTPHSRIGWNAPRPVHRWRRRRPSIRWLAEKPTARM